jgi:exodeoxyribonuclease-1
METLYWHDYETFGRDPAKDRLAQFAGIRTDINLNIIGKPLVKYCKVSSDTLPDPGACLVTDITPQIANEKGICEAEFIGLIHQELNKPGTCTVGYNSSQFDDEFTRYALYRNFFNPYEHHDNRKGNSRWDLINVVRLVRALNPNGEVIWPRKEDGKYSTRLQDLTEANSIDHYGAHDALVDVEATIALARLLREKFPRLYNYCYQHRTKKKVADLLGVEKKRLKNPKPLVHVDSIYGSDANYLGVIYPVAMHPTQGNNVIVYNILKAPDPIIDLPSTEIRERLFTKDLGDKRISLHGLNLGKCPVLIPLSRISQNSAELLNIDKQLCAEHVQRISEKEDIGYVVQTAYNKSFKDRTDPDLMLYDGFFGRNDKARINKVRSTNASDLAKTDFGFEDKRLPEMLFRYRARNFPTSLSKAEKNKWNSYCQHRFHDENGGGSLTLEQYYLKIEEELAKNLPKDKIDVLKKLQDYGRLITGN